MAELLFKKPMVVRGDAHMIQRQHTRAVFEVWVAAYKVIEC